jgi:8-oxo-dGTP diphosphatase
MQEVIKVVAAVVELDGKYLACRRGASKSLPGKWEFPGGKVELGETFEGAAIREILEELAVTIEVESFLGLSITDQGSITIELHAYLAKLVGSKPVGSQDHDTLMWCTVEELSKLDWAPADIPIVALVANLSK